MLTSPDAEWPKPDARPRGGKTVIFEKRPEGYRWKGYTLDAKRIPTFSYEWNGVKVSDRFDVEGDATAGGKFVRTLKMDGAIPANAWLRIASGEIKQAGGAFLVDGGVFDVQGRHFEVQYIVAADGAQIAGRNLLVPARAEIKITYAWPHSHAQHGH